MQDLDKKGKGRGGDGGVMNKVTLAIIGVIGAIIVLSLVFSSGSTLFPDWSSAGLPSVVTTILPLVIGLALILVVFGLAQMKRNKFFKELKSMSRKGMTGKVETAIFVVIGIIIVVSLLASAGSSLFPNWSTLGNAPSYFATVMPFAMILFVVLLILGFVKYGRGKR